MLILCITQVRVALLGRLHSTEVASHPTLSRPAARGLILGIPMNISCDVADIYWQHCLEMWTEA